MATKKPSQGDGSSIEQFMVEHAKSESGSFGSFEVTIRLKKEYYALLRDMTKNNIDKSLAIVVDSWVLSYPRVASEIEGGNLSISGNFTEHETIALACMVNNPPLPLAVQVQSMAWGMRNEEWRTVLCLLLIISLLPLSGSVSLVSSINRWRYELWRRALQLRGIPGRNVRIVHVNSRIARSRLFFAIRSALFPTHLGAVCLFLDFRHKEPSSLHNAIGTPPKVLWLLQANGLVHGETSFRGKPPGFLRLKNAL